MIKHIVMWRVKDKALGKTKDENIIEIKNMLENLKSHIAEIKHIEVGINIENLTGSHDVILNTTFEDEEALNAYQKHPKHLESAKFIREVVMDRACVDYEVGEK